MENNCLILPKMPVNETVLKCKESYYQKLIEYDEKQCGAKTPWTEAKVQQVINHIKNFKEAGASGKQRTSSEYYWTNKYDIITTVNGEYLIFKKKNPNDPSVLVLPREQYFDILYEVHESCGHGGRDKMQLNLKSKVYIPVKAVEIFLTICPKCSTKPKKGVVLARPNMKGLFQLIDFQSCPDDDFKWVLHYQDDTTKYSWLRPLKTESVKEVSSELLKIFLTFGSPDFLQSCIDEKYTLRVIEEINSMWPSCKILSTKPDKLASDQEMEIDNMLRTWMNDNNSSNWSLGCYFVQYLKNVAANETVGKTPYKALFGRDPKVDSNVNNNPTTSDTEEQKISDDEPSQNTNENTHLSKINLEKFQSLQNLTCIVCQTEASAKTGAHKCMSCKSVHVLCGLSDGSEITNSKILCFICNRSIQIENDEEQKGIKRGAEHFDDKAKKAAVTSNPTIPIMQRDPLTVPVSFELAPLHCTCRPKYNQCHTQKCSCYKNKTPCGLKCHSGANCSNRC